MPAALRLNSNELVILREAPVPLLVQVRVPAAPSLPESLVVLLVSARGRGTLFMCLRRSHALRGIAWLCWRFSRLRRFNSRRVHLADLLNDDDAFRRGMPEFDLNLGGRLVAPFQRRFVTLL
jgi:hypothetical protein